jgi:hypothetical protein
MHLRQRDGRKLYLGVLVYTLSSSQGNVVALEKFFG